LSLSITVERTWAGCWNSFEGHRVFHVKHQRTRVSWLCTQPGTQPAGAVVV